MISSIYSIPFHFDVVRAWFFVFSHHCLSYQVCTSLKTAATNTFSFFTINVAEKFFLRSQLCRKLVLGYPWILFDIKNRQHTWSRSLYATASSVSRIICCFWCCLDEIRSGMVVILVTLFILVNKLANSHEVFLKLILLCTRWVFLSVWVKVT